VLEVFYTETGAYPIAALGRGVSWQAGPLYWVSSPGLLHFVFAACLLVTLAFTAGWGMRYVKWLLLPVLFTLDGRTPPLFTGGEAVLHSQALYVALLPVGSAFSVDAWLGSRRRDARAKGGVHGTAIKTFVYPLVLLQLAVIYFFNTRAKMGDSWHNGQAVAETLGAATLVSSLGAWIRQLPPSLLHGLTYGTLVIEGVLPLLLLSPWGRRRTHAVAAALMLALHGGIYLALEVGSFSAAMLSYVPLLWHPRGEEERVLVRAPRAQRLEAVVVLLLVYLGAARLSRDLILWPERPELPLPKPVDAATFALGLVQPWMMFSPVPPDRDFIIVTDAVTRKGLHFDPWRRAATGVADIFKQQPQSVGRAHIFTRYESYLSSGTVSAMHPFFGRWVLAQRGPDGEPVERFDSWLLMVSTDPARLIPGKELEARVGVTPLPLPDPLRIASFQAVGVWAPERAIDRKIAPEGTHVFTPMGASMSAGCARLTLDLGEPHPLHSAYLQADTSDHFIIEGSVDGQNFRQLAEMPPVEGWHFRSRIIALPGDSARFVRIRPARAQAFRHFLSEVALFDHPVTLPPLSTRPTEEFMSALERPSVTGIISGSNHPSLDCPAESPAVMATPRVLKPGR
jgi:hypothetical protein